MAGVDLGDLQRRLARLGVHLDLDDQQGTAGAGSADAGGCADAVEGHGAAAGGGDASAASRLAAPLLAELDGGGAGSGDGDDEGDGGGVDCWADFHT